MLVSMGIRNRRSILAVEVEGTYSLLRPEKSASPRHPIFHSRSSPKQPKNRKIYHPSMSAIINSISELQFPVSLGFLRTSFLAAQIPFVSAGGLGDELSNNIISDIGPLVALFGERVTQQFMSQSMGIVDNIIFAVAPLGIITAMVGAIRVGGPRVMRAIIGRAKESRPAVEIELMSSTSRDVCELWDGEGVVRVLGKPPIIELIYVIPNKSSGDNGSALPNKWEKDVGIYDFHSAKRQSNDCRLLVRVSSSHQEADLDTAPNISLNIGGRRISELELWAVAIFGIMLQSGVIVYALLSSFLIPWNSKFQKEGYRVIVYTPVMAGGTLALVVGMFLCSYVIEQSTVEESWEIMQQEGATVRVAWLQRGGMVNDQLFNSYAIFPAIPRAKLSVVASIFERFHRWGDGCARNRVSEASAEQSTQDSKTVRAMHNNRIWRLIGASFRLVYNVGDWIVLVSVAAVSSTLSSVSNQLRFWLRAFCGPGSRRFGLSLIRNRRPKIHTSRPRMTANLNFLAILAVCVSFCGFVGQILGLRGLHWSITVAQLVAILLMTILRVCVQRNIIHKPYDHQIVSGYELEWMARNIKGCEHWNLVTWGFHRTSTLQISPTDIDALAKNVMAARRRLGALSTWPSQWQNIVNSITEAIAVSMNYLFSSSDFTLVGDHWATDTCFKWTLVVEVGADTVDHELHLQEITLNLNRSKLLDGSWGPWRVVKSEIEAVFGLWMLHFKDLELHSLQEEKHPDGEISDWQRDQDDFLPGKPILRVLGPYDELTRMNYERWITRKTRHMLVENLENLTTGESRKYDHVIGNPKKDNLGPEAPVLGAITYTAFERVCGQMIFAEFISNISEHVEIGGEVHLRGGDTGEISSFGLLSTGLTGLAKIVEQARLANIEEAYMSIVPAFGRLKKLPIGPGDIGTLFGDMVKESNRQANAGQFEQSERFLLWLFHCADTSVNFYRVQGDWRKAVDIYMHLHNACQKISHNIEYIDEVGTRISLFCESAFTFTAVEARDRNPDDPKAASDALDQIVTYMEGALGSIPRTELAKWESASLGEFQLVSGTTRDEQLLQAAAHGKSILVEQLLKDGASIKARDSSNQRTALVLACIFGHTAVVTQLIDRKADPNAKDYYGRTSLHYASEKGHTSVVRTLLLCEGLVIDISDKNGQTPLYLANENKVGAVVNLLLFYGADELHTGARKFLHQSLRKGSCAALDTMRQQEWNLVDKYDRTPAHWSVWRGSKRALEKLLLNQAVTQTGDGTGNTPLHLASMNGSLPMIEMLLVKAANMEAKDGRGRTALHQAAGVGHGAAVRLLLKRGANSKAKDENEEMPIHVAVLGGDLATVRLLLQEEAKLETKYHDGDTLLHGATSEGHEAIVRLLLEKGVEIEATDAKGETPLHRAVSKGHEAIARLLIDRGANKDLLYKDLLYKEQLTLLQEAVSHGHEAIVHLLLHHNSDEKATYEDGGTLLHKAASNGHEAIVRLLLSRGANKEAKNTIGDTPLQYATIRGWEAVVELLLVGVAIKEVKWDNGDTLLHRAPDEVMVELLLKLGADKEAKNGKGNTPLHEATSRGHAATVQRLFEKGATMTRYRNGDTLLHEAASKGHAEIMRLLLAMGVDDEGESYSGETALHKAASEHKGIVRLLLDRGVNKESKDYSGKTALHKAVVAGNIAVVQLLLDQGANKDAKDHRGDTPLHLAATKETDEHEEITQLLLVRGANKDARSIRGETPLHAAAKSRNERIVRLLLHHEVKINDQTIFGKTALDLAKMGRSNAIVKLIQAQEERVNARHSYSWHS